MDSDLKIRNKNSGLPGGFNYRHPISGYVLAYKNWTNLRNAVTAHCEGNGYPPVSDEELERYLCAHLASEDSLQRYCTGEGVPISGVGLGWADVIRFSKTAFRFFTSGMKLVPQAEADRRAAICKGCPNNVHVTMPCASGCPEFAGYISGLIGMNKTADDDKLQSCSSCRCILKIKTWVPLDTIRAGDTAEVTARYDKRCWILKENEVK